MIRRDQKLPCIDLRTLKSQERIGDNAGVSRTLREIMTIYDQQDELVNAIRYGERALSSAKEVYDQQQIAASYHLLGLLYQYADTQSSCDCDERSPKSLGTVGKCDRLAKHDHGFC